MPYTTVTGSRSDGKYYIDEGYVYKSDTVKRGSRYLKCSEISCPSTAVIRNAAPNIEITTHHTHPPNEEEEEMVNFRHSIRKRAADITNCTAFRSVYDTESARYPVGSILRSFPKDEQIMRRSRNKAIPPIPKDLDDLHDILNLQPQWRPFALAHQSQSEFFRETIIAGDGSRVSVLVSPYFEDLLCQEGVQIAADGTFDSRPQCPKSEQLLSIHAFEVIDEVRYCWPCAYALMEKKSESAYIAAWEGINNSVNVQMRPGTLMGDFERALHTSAVKVFPNISTSGCWFHYSNALYTNAVQLGVADEGLQNEAADKCLLKCMALPLLPPGELDNGLHLIKEEVETNGLVNNFRSFFAYIQDTWLDENRVGADMLSVFELDSRTNNSVENAHFQLFKKINVCHPNFWVFYNAVLTYDYAQHQDRVRAKRNIKIKRSRRAASIKQDENIEAMQSALVNGLSTVQEFLDRACHTVEGLQKRLKAHHTQVVNRRQGRGAQQV